MKRIVVTGIGAVTPVGVGREEVWKNLLAGRTGIAPVESFDTNDFSVHLGGEVKDFRPEEHVRRFDPNHLGRAAQFAVAAARMALEDAGLDPDEFDPEQTGVVMGTTSGEPLEVEHFNNLMVSEQIDQLGARFMRRYPCHHIAGYVAGELGLAGPNALIPTACAAGNYAVAQALDLLRAGSAEVMLAGGADAFSRITYTGFARLGAIAPERVQPFDLNRQGMVPGEGSAVLVLEPLDTAQRRGARIFAEVVGYGLSCDAFHMTGSHPEGDGAIRAMRQALESSGIDPAQVGYVSAHGTGTATNDRMESRALHVVFGERAPQIPMSSIKSMLGHTMGAASAIESAVCSMAIATGKIPPTIGFETPDPECDVDCVPNVFREQAVEVAMNNAYAFGGNNASVLFRKVAV